MISVRGETTPSIFPGSGPIDFALKFSLEVLNDYSKTLPPCTSLSLPEVFIGFHFTPRDVLRTSGIVPATVVINGKTSAGPVNITDGLAMLARALPLAKGTSVLVVVTLNAPLVQPAAAGFSGTQRTAGQSRLRHTPRRNGNDQTCIGSTALHVHGGDEGQQRTGEVLPDIQLRANV